MAKRDGLSKALKLAWCRAHSCFSCRAFCLHPKQSQTSLEAMPHGHGKQGTGAGLWASSLMDHVPAVTSDQVSLKWRQCLFL